MPGKYLQLGRDSFLSNSFTFIECVEELHGSAVGLRPFQWLTELAKCVDQNVAFPLLQCDRRYDLKKITNQKDMKFEENYFIHLVFTTQNRGEIFTSIYVRTQFWRYNLHVHPTSVLHTSIRGDIQTKLHCSIQQKFKMERQFAKAFSTSVRSFASAPGTFQRVRQSTIKRVQTCTDSGGGYFEYLL